MRAVTVKLPAELDDLVTRLARAEGTTRSAVVRRAIEAYWAQESGAKRGEDEEPFVSFLDLNRDLIGVASGPPDLSTNEDHLESFGE